MSEVVGPSPEERIRRSIIVRHRGSFRRKWDEYIHEIPGIQPYSYDGSGAPHPKILEGGKETLSKENPVAIASLGKLGTITLGNEVQLSIRGPRNDTEDATMQLAFPGHIDDLPLRIRELTVIGNAPGDSSTLFSKESPVETSKFAQGLVQAQAGKCEILGIEVPVRTIAVPNGEAVADQHVALMLEQDYDGTMYLLIEAMQFEKDTSIIPTPYPKPEIQSRHPFRAVVAAREAEERARRRESIFNMRMRAQPPRRPVEPLPFVPRVETDSIVRVEQEGATETVAMAAASVPGSSMTRNADAVGIDSHTGTGILADGIGRSFVVKHDRAFFSYHISQAIVGYENPTKITSITQAMREVPTNETPEKTRQALVKAMGAVNEDIFRTGLEGQLMSTVVAFRVVEENGEKTLAWAAVGDSTLYIYRTDAQGQTTLMPVNHEQRAARMAYLREEGIRVEIASDELQHICTTLNLLSPSTDEEHAYIKIPQTPEGKRIYTDLENALKTGVFVDGKITGLTPIDDMQTVLAAPADKRTVIKEAMAQLVNTFYAIRNLTYGLGIERDITDNIDSGLEKLQPGDVIVAVTDGVSDNIGPGLAKVIADARENHPDNLQEQAAYIVAKAHLGAKKDDASALLAQVT